MAAKFTPVAIRTDGQPGRDAMTVRLEALGAYEGFPAMRINTINATAWQGMVAARNLPTFEERVEAGVANAMEYVAETRKRLG